MKAKLRREILTETYEDMKGLITGTAWLFWKTYGGDLDDLNAQANLIFIYALDDFDSSKAKLTTWLTFKIRKGLLDYLKNGYKSKHLLIEDLLDKGFTPDFIESKTKARRAFSVMELLDELERDACVVLWLFLSTPKEVLLSILDNKKRVDGTKSCRSCMRGCMQNRLSNRLRQMGWTLHRIKDAFDDIKKVTSY